MKVTVHTVALQEPVMNITTNTIFITFNKTTMEIKVDGRLLVSTLCERFKEEFGGTLRVLNICFLY